MSDLTEAQTAATLLLAEAPGNAVVYSEQAWAAARKQSDGGGFMGRWFPDNGAHKMPSLSVNQMVEWVDDWTLMIPLKRRNRPVEIVESPEQMERLLGAEES